MNSRTTLLIGNEPFSGIRNLPFCGKPEIFSKFEDRRKKMLELLKMKFDLVIFAHDTNHPEFVMEELNALMIRYEGDFERHHHDSKINGCKKKWDIQPGDTIVVIPHGRKWIEVYTVPSFKEAPQTALA